MKLKDTDKCSKILKTIENSIEENDIDRRIQCKLIKYTLFNIDEKLEQAETVLIDTYMLAKNSGKLAKAGELAMRVGKYFIDKKEEEEASYYLNQGIQLFNEAEKLKN